MSQTTNLVWFRNDLRVADNPALYSACQSPVAKVLAVFIVTTEQWKSHDWGDPRATFMYGALRDLRSELLELNIPLLIRTTDTFDESTRSLRKLGKELKVTDLFFNREYELNERRRDQHIQKMCESEGIECHAFHDQVVVPPDHAELKTGDGRRYVVFTPFKKKWIAIAQKNGLLACRKRPSKRNKLTSDPDPLLAFKDFWHGEETSHSEMATLSHAKKKLTSFTKDNIFQYDQDRDIPSVQGTSGISPYLASGMLSPRQCIGSVLKVNENRLDGTKSGDQVWISEIIWRDFYRYVAYHHPQVCKYKPFQEYTADVVWRDAKDEFDLWCAGRTGYPLVDAGMRQLNNTGWMHNRLRMVTAMFLTKHLLIDWRWGERYFMNKLVDADFCSNNGGWQWSASTGTDAAPYFRIFNPLSQSKKFDPDAKFIKEMIPELRDVPSNQIHNPEKMARPESYPPMIVSQKLGRARAIDAFKRAKG